MSETTVQSRADAQGEKLDAILKAVAGLIARVDDMEKNLPAPPLVTAADKKAKKDDDDAYGDDDEEDDRKDDDDRKDSMKVKKDKAMKKAKKDDNLEDLKEWQAEHKKDDDEEEDDRKDAEGSNPVVHGKAGEIKPDDEDDRADDDEEEAAKKDEEEAAMCDAQAKADSVFSAFGKSASRPLAGESLMAYRKRMLRGLQGYSDAYKGVNINSIKDEALLALAEKQIFADAVAASRASTHIGAGQLVELHEKDRAGRTITKFRGDMEAWLGDFKVPALRVMKFNTLNNIQR